MTDAGAPLAAASKYQYLGAIRMFLRDCQEWGWCTRHFDPARTLATPRSVNALIGPNPRVIANEVWAKLLWAGLNLEESDLPSIRGHADYCDRSMPAYPLPLIKATAPPAGD